MKLAVVAGEASGDLHASEVIRELNRPNPPKNEYTLAEAFRFSLNVVFAQLALKLGPERLTPKLPRRTQCSRPWPRRASRAPSTPSSNRWSATGMWR